MAAASGVFEPDGTVEINSPVVQSISLMPEEVRLKIEEEIDLRRPLF